MKILRQIGWSVAAAAALFLFAAPAGASPAVQRVGIRFDTLDGGKPLGCGLTVLIQNSSGLVASISDFGKAPFAANSTSQEFLVPVTHGTLTADELSSFKVTVLMQGPPGRNDSWRFKYAIVIHLASGTVITRTTPACELKSHSGGAVSVVRDFHL